MFEFAGNVGEFANSILNGFTSLGPDVQGGIIIAIIASLVLTLVKPVFKATAVASRLGLTTVSRVADSLTFVLSNVSRGANWLHRKISPSNTREVVREEVKSAIAKSAKPTMTVDDYITQIRKLCEKHIKNC